eukprot:jgi/Astpho2/7379/Aster-x0315
MVRGYTRPDIAPDVAIVSLMDARGTLTELKVSSAAPIVAALATGSQSEATLSKLYGGSAEEGVSELSVAVPVYEAIGKVITISGRTIRKEAQADPEIAEHAISCIDKLLSICPEQDIRNAQELRKVRPKAV